MTPAIASNSARSAILKPLLLMATMVVAGLAGFSNAPAKAAGIKMAEPAPSMDNPRKIILQITSKNARTMNNVLSNVVNIQKFYGQDNVKIAVVAYADGLHALYKRSSPVLDRIKSLLHYDVEFVACGNTLTATKRHAKELIPGVTVVRAGIPEIVERSLQGWVYIRP
jgi:intracellular sulfur oxidation DsrE/DsrF family protein